MRKLILLCGFSALTCTAVQAGDVTVQWQEPEKFTDIRPANDSRSKYRDRVMQKFDGFFNEMAAKLPDGYRWQVTVTDIDLAGDVDYFIGGAGNALRVVKEIHSPAIKFSYVLRDNHGEEIANADEKLRDMSFMHSLHSVSVNEEFHYEKQMLQDWFSKVLQPKVEQYAKALPKVSNG